MIYGSKPMEGIAPARAFSVREICLTFFSKTHTVDSVLTALEGGAHHYKKSNLLCLHRVLVTSAGLLNRFKPYQLSFAQFIQSIWASRGPDSDPGVMRTGRRTGPCRIFFAIR